MSNLKPIDPNEATGKTKELLDFVQQRSSRIPNMVKLMANSPAALGAYLSLAGAFRDAMLPAKIRDLIAVTVAETAGCDYTLSAVSALARSGGRSESELAAARAAESEDPKISAALHFAAKIVVQRGQLPESEVDMVRDAGFSDGEVAEIVATVALNIYRSYFNLIARPEIDFPVLKTGSSPVAQMQA
jgi:AhpD family alkylhydroperoxidase